MSPYTTEQSILEGKSEVKELFAFVIENAAAMDAYAVEGAIFERMMGIGVAAMKCYFAKKGIR